MSEQVRTAVPDQFFVFFSLSVSCCASGTLDKLSNPALRAQPLLSTVCVLRLKRDGISEKKNSTVSVLVFVQMAIKTPIHF